MVGWLAQTHSLPTNIPQVHGHSEHNPRADEHGACVTTQTSQQNKMMWLRIQYGWLGKNERKDSGPDIPVIVLVLCSRWEAYGVARHWKDCKDKAETQGPNLFCLETISHHFSENENGPWCIHLHKCSGFPPSAGNISADWRLNPFNQRTKKQLAKPSCAC